MENRLALTRYRIYLYPRRFIPVCLLELVLQSVNLWFTITTNFAASVYHRALKRHFSWFRTSSSLGLANTDVLKIIKVIVSVILVWFVRFFVFPHLLYESRDVLILHVFKIISTKQFSLQCALYYLPWFDLKCLARMI